MKLPRDLSAAELEKALRRALGSRFVRQLGSHRPLMARSRHEHDLTIPKHAPLRPGTLRAILGEVMTHHRLTLEQVLQRLGLA